MKTRNVEKRLADLERVLIPKPKGKPPVVFIQPVGYEGMTEAKYRASIKDLGAGQAAMVLPRPGDKARNTPAEKSAEARLKELGESGSIVIGVVNVEGTGSKPEPEPDDAELEAECLRLERKKAALKARGGRR